jgi:hypothetical protein
MNLVCSLPALTVWAASIDVPDNTRDLEHTSDQEDRQTNAGQHNSSAQTIHVSLNHSLLSNRPSLPSNASSGEDLGDQLDYITILSVYQ